jgi:glycine hydroxymethyltransferase
MVLCRQEHAAAIDKGVFPNAQGGPINNQIAAKAVCFHEAATPEFRAYAAQIVRNAAAMAAAVQSQGVRVVSGGTDNHLFLVDLRSVDAELSGRDAARLLSTVGITLNFNTIPFDPRPPYRASGLRIGLPAATTCGMKEPEVDEVGRLLATALQQRQDAAALSRVRTRITELAVAFPAYPADFPGHV